MKIQILVDEINAQMQRHRSKTQITLKKMIDALENLPEESYIENIGGAHSYRGYYCDLAFEHNGGMRLVDELLLECKSLIGNSFYGYKGGKYVMTEDTPLWIAKEGHIGEKIIAINNNGSIETETDE